MLLSDEICKLPVTEVCEDLIKNLASGATAILKAPPGSGKSTALPAMLLNENIFGNKKILMLEPRRIACLMVAQRIAYLLGEKVGETVGYRMRGEKKISSRTRLEIVTEGTFTRMIQNDMELKDYALVIFDEFHERNIHSDLGLALASDVKNNLRDDLSLLVMSATLNSDELRDFLPDAVYFECGGKMFETEIFYASERIADEDIVNSAFIRTMQILKEYNNGNILIFLSGAYEIRTLCSILEKHVDENVIIAPLYGALSKDEQQKALKKTVGNERKIVIATNIAESSVTIDDIKFVIDSGREKRLVFSSDCGMDRLQTVRIAKSSAIQRAGRAGRTSDGIVYRLYTIFEYEGTADFPQPEIACTDLANFCLELAMWGCKAEDLTFLTPPSAGSIAQAEKLLFELDLIDEAGGVTDCGRKVGNFPGSCRLGKIFYEAQKTGLESLGCELAVLMEERNLPASDIVQSLEILRRNPTFSYKCNLDLMLKEKGIEYQKSDANSAGRLIFCGYPDRAGKRRNGSLNGYQLANGREAVISEAFEGRDGEFIVAPLLDMGGRQTKIHAAAVFAPSLFPENKITYTNESYFDERSGKFITEKVKYFYNMVLDRKISNEFDEAAFKKAVLGECRKRSLEAVFALDEDDINFLNRCSFAHFSEPDFYPEMSIEKLLADGRFIDYADCSAHSLAALKKLSFRDILKNFIGYEIVYALDRDFPERYLTPGGSNYKIRYEAEDAVLSVPVAEMYGTKIHPVLGRKRFPLRMELLSPAMRPVQVTRDLPGFWKNNWSYVQKEMKQRYIKHFWPDDPANASPGRSIRKKQ